MNEQPGFHTRREFIRRTVLGGALTWTVPGFLANTFAALQREAENGRRTATGRDSRILVVLQMAGGNDGINTLVPFASDHYRRARPRLALPESGVLRLNDDVALHAGLAGFKDLYDAGQLAILQGVGYPNPNRSHFRSTEIWQTAAEANKFEHYGWLGRYFDNTCAGADPTVGITVGRQMPQAFSAQNPCGVTVDNPRNYRFLPAKGAGKTQIAETEDSYRKLNTVEKESENSGGSIGAIAGAGPMAGSPLDFLERTALDAQVSSDRIRSLAAGGENHGDYPPSSLANSLKLLARLIGGGMTTRVYYVSQGGYDTHTNQLAAQERLLRDLGDSIRAFLADLRAQGNEERVLIMTFSEFGRRVAENASGGTDHGAAAPMFIAGGGALRAGLHGAYPSLAPADLFQGDIKYSTDFRAVYATILERWLRTGSEPILGRKFPLLDFLPASA